ncbi:hypothetical protein JCM8097_009134 [Rhodosporidiobolus ruineniae]
MPDADLIVSGPSGLSALAPPPQDNANGLRKPRTSKACTRCRRFRQKCVHETIDGKQPKPPCEACVKAGEAVGCTFVPRGYSAEDRSFRRKRPREETTFPAVPPPPPALPLPPAPVALPAAPAAPPTYPPPLPQLPISAASPDTLRSQLLPPHDELVEGICAFTASYFQLGFLAESHFLEQLEQDPASISTFLLLSILTISARFAPSLVKRFGSRRAATEAFSARAMSLVPDEMLKPSLERTQAFFLLGVSEWGAGYGQRSWMLMGIAVRMAGLLRLHREDAYTLPADAEPDEVIRSELARRTFWILVCHDALTSGSHRPASFAFSEISAKLPGDEEELAFGLPAARRSTLGGTQAAQLDPASVNLPSRSLFASMITSHCLFGKVAQLACNNEKVPSGRPWEPTSEYAVLLRKLQEYERSLPPLHVWGIHTLRGMRAKKLDLALLSTSHIIRLAHIVLARIYLPSIAAAVDGSVAGTAPPGFWKDLAAKMSKDARELLQQVETFFSFRSPSEGFPPIMVFGLFAAGDLASLPLVSPSLELGASGLLGFGAVPPTPPNPLVPLVPTPTSNTLPLPGPSSTSPFAALPSPASLLQPSGLVVPPSSLPSAFGASFDPPSGFTPDPTPFQPAGAASDSLLFFPDLAADLATFLQGDVQPAFQDEEYRPDRPFIW